jgi:hypothetical protein
VRAYNINPGLWYVKGGEISRIGVICHELGHFLGLPDLYDGTSPFHATFGAFGIMSDAWGVDGSQRYPGSFSPWSKEFLGWAEIVDVGEPGTKTFRGANHFFKITRGYPANEYLLVESRSNTTSVFNAQLPGGIYVWHIDTDASRNAWNNNGGYPGDAAGWPGRHDRVRLIQADNRWDNEKLRWWVHDARDAYVSPSQVLDDKSAPNLLSYAAQARGAVCKTTGNRLYNFVFNTTGASQFDYTVVEQNSACFPTDKPTGRPTTRKPTTSMPTRKPTTSMPTRKPTTRKPTREPTARKK